MADSHSEIVGATADETGGPHNQKGVEFQRNWAVIKMLALEEAGAQDYLFLFEALQDVAVLDSATDPKAADIYQIKKKDRGEWTWPSLTGLHMPAAKTKKALKDVSASVIGKLHGTMRRLKSMKVTGRFISNAGCDLALDDGGNASTSLPVELSKLTKPYRELLESALAEVNPGEPAPDLGSIGLEKVDLPSGDAVTYSIGKANAFLHGRSKKHAGQARSFVEGLLAQIGPLGARTESCATFEQLRGQHGFTRKEFLDALMSLESIPDMDALVDGWLKQLQSEGLGFRQVTAIKVAVAAIYQRRVLGSLAADDASICENCDTWLAGQPDPIRLLPFLESATAYLTGLHPQRRDVELQAHFLLQAIEKCADQTFAS